MLKDAKVASEEGRAVSLIFPSGDIHIYEQSLPDYKLFISNHDHQDRRHVAMMLDSLSNLSIIGNNSKLQLHGRLVPIKDCTNMLIKGISIDYPRPAMSQIEITEISPKANGVKAKVLSETLYRI